MLCTAGLGRFARWTLCIVILCACVTAARAQLPLGGFVTGRAAEAWTGWEAAMQAVLAKDDDATEAAFAELLGADPSPLRLALFRARTPGSPIGGAVLLFEQDVEAGTLGDNGKRLGEMLTTGGEQMNQADDGWWFASIGRFDVANANFGALLNSDPDPVALLEFADQKKRRHETLVQLINHRVMGQSAARMIKLLARGESMIKSDPGRIRNQIERLSGPPRAFENAIAALEDSGEYAIPFLIQTLRDPDKRNLTQAIVRALPLIDRGALNPLVLALRMNDPSIKSYVIRALGAIPYRQSLPYLMQLKQDSATAPQTQADVAAALAGLRSLGIDVDDGIPAGRLFYSLAEAYYENRGSLAADPRLDTANVWYWREDMIQNIEVPTQIFNEIMCMRSCEEALLLDPSMKEALALWLAANFRREAQLEPVQTDATRPDNYPSAAYFAQSGGAEYCMMVLARAVRDADAAVALGAIEALHNTAGPSSMVGEETSKQPLAEALNFPNRMVRVRAALALGQARPGASFNNYQNLMPVLAEALMLHGGSRGALVIDPDESSLNATTAILRGEGYTVLTNSSLLPGLEQVRKELPGLDVVFVASDIQDPNLKSGLHSIRTDPTFRALPVVIVSKRGSRDAVRTLVRSDHRLTDVLPDDEPGRVLDAIARVSKAVGFAAITEDLGGQLALEAAETLRDLAKTNNEVFDLSRAQNALVAVIAATDDADLRLTVAEVLGYMASGEAQEAIARIALDPSRDVDTRVSMLTALSEAAKRRGNLLGSSSVDSLINLVKNEQDEALRTAASQALGALNLPSNRARELIIKHYGG